MTAVKIVIIVAVVLVLGIIVFPLINRKSFRNLSPEQQVRVIMKQANKLIYFKNVSKGTTGTLYFVKNKRKILLFPWALVDGKMVCTRKNPLDHWDYPEEKEPLTNEEKELTIDELKKFNKGNPVKLYINGIDL